MIDSLAASVDLVVGLGNPGPEYGASRHNVGFMVVDELMRRFDAGPWRRRHRSDLASAERGRKIWLAKPMTYMNRSGTALVALLHGLDIEPERTLVVVDDIDLPLATLRLRPNGGPGTHNGLRDLVANIGLGFPRLRLGVCGEEPWPDLAEYVLAPFADHEQELVDGQIAKAADAAEAALFVGIGEAMNQFNQKPEPAAPAS